MKYTETETVHGFNLGSAPNCISIVCTSQRSEAEKNKIDKTWNYKQGPRIRSLNAQIIVAVILFVNSKTMGWSWTSSPLSEITFLPFKVAVEVPK